MATISRKSARRTRPSEPGPPLAKSAKRGKPFTNGDDPRRNRSGRKVAPKRTPMDEAIASIMAPVTVTQNGRRRKRPKIAVAIDQQVNAAMQGDQSAARAAATLIRAIAAIVRPPSAGDKNAASSNDERNLDKVLKDFTARVERAALNRSSSK